MGRWGGGGGGGGLGGIKGQVRNKVVVSLCSKFLTFEKNFI